MNRIAILFSAVISSAMAAPFNSLAVVPQPQKTVEEFIVIYRNSEDEFDFNLDGVVDTIDAKCVLTRCSELVVGKNTSVVVVDEFESENGERLTFEFTNKMREKIDEFGDVDGDSLVSAIDAAYLLTAYYSDKEIGDVNTDGKLDAKDASKILKFYADNSVSIQSNYVTEKNMEYLGDLNSDGKVDSSDASYVLVEYSRLATE
ncbi:MAG: hypothetical protein J6Y71_00375 [Ruminococcus sp.]|nr:hypothetical protein [Ruminococcus sp.]